MYVGKPLSICEKYEKWHNRIITRNHPGQKKKKKKKMRRTFDRGRGAHIYHDAPHLTCARCPSNPNPNPTISYRAPRFCSFEDSLGWAVNGVRRCARP